MLDINAEEVFTIGIVGRHAPADRREERAPGRSPVKGIYSWEPGSHFGIYSPDTFYWQAGHR
jgi:peptide/nickel transport system substrate-binding protein